jgi:hypothetical protein
VVYVSIAALAHRYAVPVRSDFRRAVDTVRSASRATFLPAPQPPLRSASSWDHRGRSGLCENAHDGYARLVLATGEDQNDACEDEMDALFEFLTAEPATCPTA